MPPASAVNSNNAAAQAAKAERAEKLKNKLRGFIVVERQRRQEEYETQCEELRLRREREARERENTITLADTRAEISRLDEQLSDLKNQKHQLMDQLKKVVNEDETRKKQIKENELFAMQQAMQQATASVVPAQVFVPPVRLQHHQVPMLQKAPSGSQPTKRGRSPSPPSQHQVYYKNAANYAQQKHDDYRRGADYARMSWNKATAQYPSTGTLFYQTTAAPPTTQQQADARLQSIYNYSMPLRPAYHVELQAGPSATVSKAPDSQKAQPMPVLHINLDQPPPISQADLVVQAGSGASSLSVQTSKPQVTMEKLPERCHIELKYDGAPSSGHVPPPPHLLSADGVIYKPLLGELSLHQNVLQINTNATQNPKATGSITQGYAPGRSAAAAHEQQMVRQQMSMLPGQPGAPGTAQSASGVQYTRRLY